MNTNYEKSNPCTKPNVTLSALALILLFGVFHHKSYSEIDKPSVLSKNTVAMREISGLAIRDKHLIAASDSETDLLKAPIKGYESGSIQFGKATRIKLSAPEGYTLSRNSNWEAVNTDASGRNFLLKENSSQVYIFDQDGKGEKVIELDSETLNVQKTKLEGMLLMQNGHILAASQTAPLTLIEFGPSNQRPLGVSTKTILGESESFLMPDDKSYRALAVWTMDKSSCGAADLARAEDGAVLILGKNCADIFYVGSLATDDSGLKAERTWSVLKGLKKPAALVSLPGLGMIIGQDRNSLKKNILYLRFPGRGIDLDHSIDPIGLADLNVP
ncbi:MAG: hypothetical protein EOP07_09610 [Proteobacteria bacterium]|nr:MAG: hypothetical protein EOP07_09610 [Pseudomonadota bacterium]